MTHGWFNTYIAIEFIFLSDMILNFFVEHINETTNKPVRNLTVIGFSYLKGEFALDFITLLPF
jgi:hypothetical protein